MSGSFGIDPVWALVPVKRFDQAKSRLAGRLDAAARAALSAAMLRDVLETISGTGGLAGTLVVTADPDAAQIARDCGAVILADHRESGINDAAAAGLASVEGRGAGGVVILPADVPLVTPAEIAAVLHGLAGRGAAIVPATRDGGTNALAFAPPSRLAPSFGPDSFIRHLAAAAAAGLDPAVLRLAGLGHDVDVEVDLPRAAGSEARGRWTRACLAECRLDLPSATSRRFERVSP